MNFYHLDVLAFQLKEHLDALAALPVPIDIQHRNNFLTYKSLDALTADKVSAARPFIFVGFPAQTGPAGYKPAFHFDVPVRERTKAAIYIESPLIWSPGPGEQLGGFDSLHHPAVLAVRAWLADNLALDVPLALQAEFKTGTVSLRREGASDEQAVLLPDGYRSLFLVELSQMQRS